MPTGSYCRPLALIDLHTKIAVRGQRSKTSLVWLVLTQDYFGAYLSTMKLLLLSTLQALLALLFELIG